MAELIHESLRCARKKYACMAWQWLDNFDLEQGELTFAELRAIAKAKAVRGVIQPGEVYLRQTVKDDEGRLYQFVAKPGLHRICLRLRVYDV